MKVDYEKIFKNGNFGKIVYENGEEDFFVVINDRIVYKNHGFDYVSSFSNEHLTSYNGSKIMIVTNNNIYSYENLIAFLNGKLKPFTNPIIWQRNVVETEEKKSTRAILTISQIKEKLGVDELTIICE